jgi:DNA-binding NtrC family response regulator
MGGLLPLNDALSMEAMARQHLQIHSHFSLDQTLKNWEQAYVDAALKMTSGNLSQAAKLLGINRTTLYSRMQSHGEL